jgi:mannose-6-phosphate isomerase-like protein (cupin superfamily)
VNREVIDVAAEAAGLEGPWSPLTLATVNDYDVRVFRAEGAFDRHTHSDTDELFLVLRGRLTIRYDDGEVVLGPGELHVVPRGTPHQPVATEGTEGTVALLLEPSATVNTGDEGGPRTAARRVR